MNEHEFGLAADPKIGCAGWALSSKVSPRFPASGSHLERYARVFRCVEINSSFYRPHQEKTYRRWAASVPPSFRFSVKMPRAITHERRLASCDDLLEAFLDEVSGLGDRLGCLLVQLPPSLSLEVNRARAFFTRLREFTSVPVACEPRHASWFTPEGAALLDEAGVAWVWADPAPAVGADPPTDGPLLYLRLHGSPVIYSSAYGEDFIEKLASRLRWAQRGGQAMWCIFDNTARGEAIPNALDVMQQLSNP